MSNRQEKNKKIFRIMNLKKIIFTVLILLVSQFFMMNVYGDLQDKIDLKENEDYVWDVNVNKEALENFEDDFDIPDDYILNEKWEKMKVTIQDIGSPKKENGSMLSNIGVGSYYSENELLEAWIRNDDVTTLKLFEYDKDVYGSGDFLLKMIYGAIVFVPNNVDWEELEKEVDDSLSNDNSLEDYKVEALSNGLSLMLEYKDLDVLELTLDYTEKGVMKTYKLFYSEDLVMERNLFEIYIPLEVIVLLITIIASGSIGIYFFIIRPRLPPSKKKAQMAKEKNKTHHKKSPQMNNRKLLKSTKKKQGIFKSKKDKTLTNSKRKLNLFPKTIVSKPKIEEGIFNINHNFTQGIRELLTQHGVTDSDNKELMLYEKKVQERLEKEGYITGILIGNTFNKPHEGYTVYAKIGQFNDEERIHLFSTLMSGREQQYFIITENFQSTATEIYWIEYEEKENDSKKPDKIFVLRRLKGDPLNLKSLFQKYSN